MVLLVRLNFGATRRQRGIWITRAKLSAGKLPALSDAVATPLVPFATPRHELDPQPPATAGVLCPWARCASWRVQTLSNEPGLDQMAAPSVASQAQKCTSKFGIQDKSGCVFLLGGPQNGGVPFGFLLKQPQDRYPKKETTQTGLEMASFGTERPEAAHVQPCLYPQPWGSAQRRKHMSIGGVLNKGDRNLSAPKQRTSKPGSKPKPTKPKQATFPSKEPQDRIPPKEVPFVACDSSNRRSLAEDLDSKRFGFQALLEACELLAARWASFFYKKGYYYYHYYYHCYYYSPVSPRVLFVVVIVCLFPVWFPEPKQPLVYTMKISHPYGCIGNSWTCVLVYLQYGEGMSSRTASMA